MNKKGKNIITGLEQASAQVQMASGFNQGDHFPEQVKHIVDIFSEYS